MLPNLREKYITSVHGRSRPFDCHNHDSKVLVRDRSGVRRAGRHQEGLERTREKQDRRTIYFSLSAATGTSMSSLRITRLVALSVASSKPWPWVMASVGQASTQ